ncbi:MAG TPA: hypothetical protein VF053_11935 [Streptosporangiales bacterium]
MRVFPVWFAADVDESARFLAALGLDTGSRAHPGSWIELEGSGGAVGVHTVSATEEPRKAGECVLAFATEEPLGDVQRRLFAAGFTDAHVIDETFGRSLRVTSPDGVVVQVNSYDAGLAS